MDQGALVVVGPSRPVPIPAATPLFASLDQLAGQGHMDGLSDVFRAQNHTLGDVAGQVLVLAHLTGDDHLGHLQELTNRNVPCPYLPKLR